MPLLPFPLWDYQRDAIRRNRERWDAEHPNYRKQWGKEHRQELADYRYEYRRQNPEATRRQWQRDTANYRQRHDPAALKERQRKYDARYHARLKAMRQALKQKGDSNNAGSSKKEHG